MSLNPTPTSPLAPVPTHLRWDNRFARLGANFHTPLAPTPVPAPYWVARSASACQALGLDPALFNSDTLLQALAGNQPIAGTQPLASVYSGHQFGHWAGQLGDGRAILLGQAEGWEVQLKGAGLTPYSRMGDGRAVLRSSIREFLCSEAMHALGVPTTRALCVVGTDLPVARETMETAAVVTRLAPSFIRFGHFEHFAARDQLDELTALANFVIDHHAPECRDLGRSGGQVHANLLRWVSERTAVMLAHWQSVGFCHGVMNTDNMSVLGLTMDYGPFQFLDAYDPNHICNHTDRGGRYAFARQPQIAYWNLHALAHAMLPLINNQDWAIQALDSYQTVFNTTLHRLMCAKLGLTNAPDQPEQDTRLIADLLDLMAKDRVDYTLFWRTLSDYRASQDAQAVQNLFINRPALEAWLLRYQERITHTECGPEANLMLKTNPKYVLRNYLGELAIKAAQAKDFSATTQLLEVLAQPFDEHPDHTHLAKLPPDWASQIEISCSS